MAADDAGPSVEKRRQALARMHLTRDGNDEAATQTLIDAFLTPKHRLDKSHLGAAQIHWSREPNLASLLPVSPMPLQSSLTFVRAGLQGRIVGTKEVHTSLRDLASAAQGASQGSSSLNRPPASSAHFVRGKVGQTMFRPGGLEDEVLKEGVAEEDDDDDGLRTIAPGLSRAFKGKDVEAAANGDAQVADEGAEEVTQGFKPAPVYRPIEEHAAKTSSAPSIEPSALDAELDELLPVERPHGASSSRGKGRMAIAKRDWAHVVDVNQTMANFHELVPDMAHKFPFELDAFQKEAVYHLEQGESVFVAAHTSAGKTVVAEYAIALASKHMTRCIYTSPIKALSNQKFRDFKETFGAENVGILTGDVQINPEAPCLIMTTEILRSMLYRGADLIRDVEFVIFDEVHYVNDQERGVVWEEVIILCPEHINLILLSATVPNTKEFADWVGRTKKKDIYVISTPKRPVPLEHFLYAGKELHKIVDARGQFLGSGIRDAGDALKRRQDKEREALGGGPGRGGAAGGRGGALQRGGAQRGGRGGARGGGGFPARGRGGGGAGSFGSTGPSFRGGADKNLWIHLVGMLKKKELLPVVVFVFSKRRCEDNASSLPNTDLCTAKEKSEVHIIIEKSLKRLKPPDRELPQIARMRDLLSRGIGVHHGGLLPIVKELVEMLFQRGLVKVLFATETFAMGVNMPARCVVFANIRKHDGHGFRELLPGEYTQMSGRAGRRGLDPTGVVIINAADELPETGILNKMLLGQPTKLQSQFRLTSSMILNLLRVETLKVEEMIKRSFSENASQRLLPEQQKKMEMIERKLSRLPSPDASRSEALSTYYDLVEGAVSCNDALLDYALTQSQGSKAFTPGRIVLLRDGHFDFDAAAIITMVGSKLFLVLAAVSQERKEGGLDVKDEEVAPRWPPTMAGKPTDGLTYDLREVPLSSIALVTSHSIKIELSMITAHRISAMNNTVEAMRPLIEQMAGLQEAPEMDWSKLRRLEFQEAVRSREGYASKLEQHLDVVTHEEFQKEYLMTHARKRLESQISALAMSISDQNLELLPDYHERMAVLKTLRFVDPVTEAVLLKGRVACEINSANELVLTELILDNTFNAYEPEEVVALLSVFLFQEKTDVSNELPPRLSEGYAAILNAAERVSAVEAKHRLNYDDFSQSLKTGLVEVVYHWAKGISFAQLTSMTDVAEGTIVRVITRLDETCREVRDAARVIGDAQLFEKMEKAQGLIRRDIVFAASLYF